jgi:hypothetical protein
MNHRGGGILGADIERLPSTGLAPIDECRSDVVSEEPPRFTPSIRNGAGEGTRTLDIQLGKLTLYQLSYARLDALAEGQFSHVGAGGKNARSLTVHARARPPARLCPDRR